MKLQKMLFAFSAHAKCESSDQPIKH